jgi:hypothetical protein
MPLRDPIRWRPETPFSDPRLMKYDLIELVRKFRKGWSSATWVAHDFENWYLDLPTKPPKYYRGYSVGTAAESGDLRIVRGKGGEVYLSGYFHKDGPTEWRQILGMPV